MHWDLVSLLSGLLSAGAVLGLCCWQLQRQHHGRATQLQVLEERLDNTQQQLTQTAHLLEECELENAELTERNTLQMARLSRLEAELYNALQNVQKLEQAQMQSSVREHECTEQLRELAAEKARLSASLTEQSQSHQARLDDLNQARDALKAQFSELAGQIFTEREQRFSSQSQAQLGQLLDPLKERIQAFESRVEQSYSAEARERFALAKELERLQGLNLRLSDEAQTLSNALRGQKTQGNWGELVLERVLESAGLERGREYQTQVSLKNAEGERFQPDVLLYLPNDRQVVIDSKVSLNAYQQVVAAVDEPERQAALKAHVQSLRAHIKGLSIKDYQRLEGLTSLDLVLIFVPIEGAFAAALQSDPALFQDAFAQRIVLVSPTTLLCTLQVVESLWRQERQGQNAREIAERAGALYDKFVAFVADLDEIGARLNQLEKAYTGARGKLLEGRGNLVGRIENLKLLGARASKKLPDALLEKAGEALALDYEQGD